MSGVEVLKLSTDADDNAQSVALTSHAAAADPTTIDGTAVDADDAVTVNARNIGNALTLTGIETFTVETGNKIDQVDASNADGRVIIAIDAPGDAVIGGDYGDVIDALMPAAAMIRWRAAWARTFCRVTPGRHFCLQRHPGWHRQRRFDQRFHPRCRQLQSEYQ